MSRADAVEKVTGCDIRGKKVLVVGAGGIGCELIKNLVLMGFEDIHMIDLDTIDYSNLNRQFLFRKHHVGESKAKTARAAVLDFPHDPIQIQADCGNIKEPQYTMDFFQAFDICLNGLDNVDARRHVNRCCLAANVPLIESGTTGYIGQVRAILKGKTMCYECNPPPAPKEYPICTIRNHPEKPVHCIAWAKELLFKKLFGGEETDLVDTAEDATEEEPAEAPSGEEAAASAGQSADKPPPPPPLVREAGESAAAFARRVFGAVFEADVERLLRMDALWKERAKPTPLRLEELELPDAARLADVEQRAWTVAENAAVFVETVRAILDERADEVGCLKFDKDDDAALDFVTAASNLRAQIFGIELQSRWTVKEIAGAIIPAIATTNAIIAGFIVLEALKVLAGNENECRYSLCNRVASGRKRDLLLQGSKLDPPNPQCYVCGTAEMSLTLDTSTFTVGMLIDLVAKKHFSFNRPTIDATPLNDDSDQLAEGAELDPIEEKDEIEKYARYRGMTLASLPKAVVNGCLLKIDDATQGDLTITLRVHHAVIDPEAAPLGFLCAGAVATAPEPEPAAGASGASKRVLDKPQSPPDGSGNPGKRPRVIEEDLDDCVMLG